MKVKMQSQVKSITRLNNETTFELEFAGKEEIAANQTTAAKTATMKATLSLKTVTADNLKIGSVFTIVISDEEPATLSD